MYAQVLNELIRRYTNQIYNKILIEELNYYLFRYLSKNHIKNHRFTNPFKISLILGPIFFIFNKSLKYLIYNKSTEFDQFQNLLEN